MHRELTSVAAHLLAFLCLVATSHAQLAELGEADLAEMRDLFRRHVVARVEGDFEAYVATLAPMREADVKMARASLEGIRISRLTSEALRRAYGPMAAPESPFTDEYLDEIVRHYGATPDGEGTASFSYHPGPRVPPPPMNGLREVPMIRTDAGWRIRRGMGYPPPPHVLEAHVARVAGLVEAMEGVRQRIEAGEYPTGGAALAALNLAVTKANHEADAAEQAVTRARVRGFEEVRRVSMDGAVRALAFSDDGSTLFAGATGTADSLVAVDTATWEMRPLPISTDEVDFYVHAILPLDDGRIAVGGAGFDPAQREDAAGDHFYRLRPLDAAVRLVDSETGEIVSRLEGNRRIVTDLAAVDGGQFVSLGFTGDLWRWDPSTGEPVWSTPISTEEPAFGVTLHAGRLYVANSMGRLFDADPATGEPGDSINTFRADRLSGSIAGDGERLVVGAPGALRVMTEDYLAPSDGRPVPLISGIDRVNDVVIAAGTGRAFVVTGNWKGALIGRDPSTGLHVVNLETGASDTIRSGGEAACLSVAVSREANLVAVGDEAGGITILTLPADLPD